MSDEQKSTKAKLAKALSVVPGMPPAMLQRAIDGYYHDYESPLAFPEIQLVTDLREMAALPTTGPRARAMLTLLVYRVINGDFDASKEEADAWARSPEGQQAFQALTGNKTDQGAHGGQGHDQGNK